MFYQTHKKERQSSSHYQMFFSFPLQFSFFLLPCLIVNLLISFTYKFFLLVFANISPKTSHLWFYPRLKAGSSASIFAKNKREQRVLWIQEKLQFKVIYNATIWNCMHRINLALPSNKKCFDILSSESKWKFWILFFVFEHSKCCPQTNQLINIQSTCLPCQIR